MGGPLFHADADAMASAATGIRESVADQSRSALEQVADDAAACGHDRLRHAMERFCDRWNDGLDLLLADAKVIGELLDRAATAYRAADQASAAELTIDPGKRVVDD